MDEEESKVSHHSAVEVFSASDEQHASAVFVVPAAAETALLLPAHEDVPNSTTTDSGVRFGQVRIHEHKNILGDNPSVSKGPPITLDWDVLASHRICLDEYETEKLRLSCEDVAAEQADGKPTDGSKTTAVRRPTRIPAPERYNIVRAAGHSRSSLERVHSEIQMIKKELRKQSSAEDLASSSPPPTAEEQELPSNPAPAWLRWIANRRAAKKNAPRRKPKAGRVI